MLKVSVVVPVYNPGSYLRRCAESLVSQTLAPQEYEVIFVDDGSTDDSPSYLDDLAAAWPQVRVIHQENSGWPGKPRNVGIDAASSTYIFFCDNDDWLAPDALANLYDFAEANSSDVVLPKMAGLGRPIAHHLFQTTLARTSLADGPLMDSLTPHKMFRRAFLNEHQIRFPEGRRRLEDHYFVVSAYLLATVISIYADRTCYTHIRRDDAGNAGFQQINWGGYFDNLAEAIEVVERHTEPGPLRDRIFRRWLQVEMVARLSGQRLLKRDRSDAESLFENAHRVAASHFGPGVVQLMQPVQRQVGQAILDGDAARIWSQAEAVAQWGARAQVLQTTWSGRTLQISGVAAIGDRAPTSPPARSPQQRFAALFTELDARGYVDGLDTAILTLDLTERTTGEQWPIPAVLHRHELATAFTADIDVAQVAAGHALAPGVWDLHAELRLLGVGNRERLKLVEGRRPKGAILPAEPLVVVGAALTSRPDRSLTLEVSPLPSPGETAGNPEPKAAPSVNAPASTGISAAGAYARRMATSARRRLRSLQR